MMKKFLSLLSVNATMLSVISFTIACNENKEIKVNKNLAEIFESKPKNVEIGINSSIFSLNEQQFNINKKIDDYFKNLQFIALSVLNKFENTCFLNTSFINVSLFRTNDTTQPIKDNDDFQKDDIALTKNIYIGFSTVAQNDKNKTATLNNNFKNLLRLDFVEYDKGLFNMEKTIQQPYCESKSHEL